MDHNILAELSDKLNDAHKALDAAMEYITRLEADNRVMKQLIVESVHRTSKEKKDG